MKSALQPTLIEICNMIQNNMNLIEWIISFHVITTSSDGWNDTWLKYNKVTSVFGSLPSNDADD